MSDAENDATRNGRHGPGGAHVRPIPATRPPLGAAPWERFFAPPADDRRHRWLPETEIEPAEPPVDDVEQGGSHAGGGVSVADLIAKIGAPDRPVHHRAASDAPDAEPSGTEPGLPIELQKTQVIDDLAYSLDAVAELRALEAADYPNDDELDEFDEFDELDDPAPESFDDGAEQPTRRRRPLLLAARSTAALAAVVALATTGGAWQWSTSKNARLNTISALD
ncbi:MAG TPA: LytR family transcriptional regulator, partial [Mycobacterium sp.]|nr:LytR family transcriptional regulator [Mycobacterium sp.]